jgi:hypothetical protein
MLASSILALSLVVHIYDSTGVAQADRAAALAIARSILMNAGIDATWGDGGERGEAAELDGHSKGSQAIPEVIVRIVTSPPDFMPGSLGFSLVDLAQRSGTLATVFIDRVNELARLAGVDAGRLLGRAVAHEIAHLLLGTARHADVGLMRGTWTTAELRREQFGDWILLPDDIARMRRGLAARERRLETPATVVAQTGRETSTKRSNQ